MSAKHTPGPWKQCNSEPFEIVMDDGDVCPLVATVNGDPACVDEDQALADAAFIVRACNAHDALLAAAEHAAKSFHHPACDAKGERSSQPERYCTCHVQKARAAIAKAEGAL